MSSLIVPSPPLGPTSVIAGLILCVLIAHFITRKRSKLSLPPGPPADPLIGHVRTFPPPERRAEVFHEWSKIYGEVFSLQVPGKTIVVLNSEKAASDLLEKRSAIYSDRPRFSFYDTLGWGDTIIFAAYGPFHNRQRKLYSDAFGKNVVSNYDHMQERGANVLIQSLMNLPEAFDRHAQLFAGGLVSEIAYGHRIESFDDKFFEAGEEYIRLSADATTPSLLDLHPLFKYWPRWAPWSGFAKTLKEIQPHMNAIIYNTYNRVQEQMSAGTAKPSFTSKHLESIYRGERSPDEHRALQLAAGMVFAAGYDTTYHTVVMFIACMMQNPEVQCKAQEEIDRVVGRGRLPDLSDRDSLPYLQCVMYETLRWHPVVPIGLPHQVTVDDEYNGMRIPKGAMIIANTRSITWDETKLKDARLYKPERFLPKPEGDGEIFPAGAVFGWGRRICAGRYLAERSVWLALARILATLNISPAKDAEGNLMPTNVITSTSITLNIEPFMCDIRPRDEKAARLIQDAPIE